MPPRTAERNGSTRLLAEGPGVRQGRIPLIGGLTFAAPSSIKPHPFVRREPRGMLATQQYLTGGVTSWSNRLWLRCRGKSSNILVKEGETVLEYQDVLILEAMKMENAIPAPEAGKIKEIKVKKDDVVATRQVLMAPEQSPSG